MTGWQHSTGSGLRAHGVLVGAGEVKQPPHDVVLPAAGLRALPKVTLDVTMPATATSLLIPPGFLQPGAAYEWEVLAIERGGNQTLSSATFTTTP
jgi:hypothetical protein